MPLTLAQCTNCNGNLEVDSSKDAAICSYCGSPFIVEKAISLYNITNHIDANTVNIYSNKADFDVRAGELLKYNGADVDVVIPNNVMIVGIKAFENCEGLRSVVIPDGVTTIKAGAFKNCKNLSSVSIASTVTEIGKNAFAYCSSIERVELPMKLKALHEDAFYNCSLLKELIISRSTDLRFHVSEDYSGRYISSAPFLGCNNLNLVLCHDGSEYGNPFAIGKGVGFFGSIFLRKYADDFLNNYSSRCMFCGGNFKAFYSKCPHCGADKDWSRWISFYIGKLMK